jgi:hypothetical protein
MKIPRPAFFLTAVTLAVLPWKSSYAAGSRGVLTAASHTPGFVKTKPWIPKSLQPNATYMIDDGTAEDAVGYGNDTQDFEALWFNQFDVIPGQTTITSVEIAWGTPLFPDELNGIPIRVGIWSDPKWRQESVRCRAAGVFSQGY